MSSTKYIHRSDNVDNYGSLNLLNFTLPPTIISVAEHNYDCLSESHTSKFAFVA